jgi:hypothetical protein
MDIYILNVGFGKMAIAINPDGSCFLIDCYLTDENRQDILAYVDTILGPQKPIDVFINSNIDKSEGIEYLHEKHPIKSIWDNNFPPHKYTRGYGSYLTYAIVFITRLSNHRISIILTM